MTARIADSHCTSRVLIGAVACIVLSACTKPADSPPASAASQELAWARDALSRNPQLEVVAADEERGVITVKQRQTGEVMALPLDAIAAAPVAMLKAAPGVTQTTAAIATETTSTTHSERSDSAPMQTQTTAAPPSEMDSGTDAATAGEAQGDSNYVIQREGGQLRVSGPGVSIVSANTSAGGRTAPQNSPATSPIICEGSRFMHLDQRNLTVEGTAVIARNGCELHITNSRIQASGVAVTVQNATVHVANSTLRGATSLEALGRARLFLRGSTFEGISRRDDSAELNDQGGNTWR